MSKPFETSFCSNGNYRAGFWNGWKTNPFRRNNHPVLANLKNKATKFQKRWQQKSPSTCTGQAPQGKRVKQPKFSREPTFITVSIFIFVAWYGAYLLGRGVRARGGPWGTRGPSRAHSPHPWTVPPPPGLRHQPPHSPENRANVAELKTCLEAHNTDWFQNTANVQSACCFSFAWATLHTADSPTRLNSTAVSNKTRV